MILLRLLNGQGLAGLAAAACLALLLIIQKGETRHWHKQSDQFQTLYRQSEAARAETVASYRQAAADAEAADRATADRVAAAQDQINHRSDHAFQTRLVDARDRARRLRGQTAAATADSGGRPKPPLPALSAGAGRVDEAADQNGLSEPDRLIATEQAIQLDELVKWVRAQSALDPNQPAPAKP